MEENTSLANEVASAGYDAAEISFDFIGMDSETALVCESDPVIKEKITKALVDRGYCVTEPVSGREALKSMRFHLYNLIVMSENFDSAGGRNSNEVLIYLQNLAAAARRNTFVALLSDNDRTMDNMMAFNKSVNLIVNRKNIDDIAKIIKQGVDDSKAFYGTFKETLKKLGRI
jgi:CheY-like chemotaxis protein